MEIITKKELASLAGDAFENAYKHGFYTECTEIETELMLIITEMAESCSGRPPQPTRKYRRL